MKKLVIVDLTPFWGGGEVYSYTIIQQLVAEGWYVTSLSCHEKHAQVASQHFKIDGNYSNFRNLIALIGRLSDSHDLIHFNGLRSIYLSFFCKRKVPFVASKHLPYFNNTKKTLKDILSFVLARLLYYNLNQIICINTAIREELPSYFKRRAVVVINGVPDKQVNPAKESPVVKMCFVGRLEEHKGICRLLEAFQIAVSKYPNLELSVAGAGEMESDVKLFIERSGLKEKIRFLGFVSSPAEVFESNHICVLPSIHEGFPLSLLEAMRSGCALIGHNIDGVNEIIRNGYNGYIAPVSSIGLSDTIALLVSNREQLKLFRRNSMTLFRQKFTAERMVRNTETVYLKAIGEA